MHRNILETVMGALVLLVAGWFLFTAYQGRANTVSVKDAYKVTALFDNVAGVSAGSDVRLGGVKIGVVDAMGLDSKTYQAKLTLLLGNATPLPEDSSASIVGDGLLGSKFVSLTPGASESMLKDGGAIEYTQSSVSLEELIGKFVFSAGGVDKEEDAKQEEHSETPSGKDEDIELTVP